MGAMDSSAIADAVDHAAALLAQAAAEVYVIDEPYNPLADVRWLGRAALFWAQLPWLKIVTALVSLLVSLASLVLANKTALLKRFDAFVTRKVVRKMRSRLAGDVSVGAVKVRLEGGHGTVTVEDFTLGNPPTAEFSSPFLVAMKKVHVKLNPLSVLGVRGRGNFVVGYLCGEVDVMSVTGATVYVDEVPDPAAGALSTKKIRNFQNLKRQSAAEAAKERAAEEAALLLLQEEKRIAEEAAKNLKAKDPEGEVSLFSTIGDTFSGASREIERQLAEVNKQAASLGSSVAGGIQAAGADVTNRLNALITLLERVNQKPPEETEEEKRKRRKLVLELRRLEFVDWNIHILAVNAKPFKFKSWELKAFKGTIGALARECASGLLNEIILDFQNEILENLTKDIKSVGDGLLNVGGTVVGGGAYVVGGIASGAGAIGKGLSDTGGAIGKGLSDTGEVIGKGLSDTGEVIGKGLTDTTQAVTGFFGFSSGGSAATTTETTETTQTTTTSAIEITETTTSVSSATVAVAAVSATAAAAAAAEARAAGDRERNLAALKEKEERAAARRREKEAAAKKKEEEAAARAVAKAEAALAREQEKKRLAEEKAAARAKAKLAEEERIAAAAIARAEAKAEAAAAAAKVAAEARARKEAESAAKAAAAEAAAAEAAAAAIADAEAAREASEKEQAEKKKQSETLRDVDLAKKIADAEAAIAAQRAARAAAESVEARKRRNAAEAKQRAALARAAVSEAGSGSEEQSEWSESGSSYGGSSYGGSGSSRGSSRASSPSRSGSPSRSSPSSSDPRAKKNIEPYLIRVKYLSGVFDIVDMDKRGVIKLKTFLKAVKRVPKIDALLKKGRNKDGRFAGDAAEARRAFVFAALERDRKREVTKEQFIRYFVWEIARSDV
jgi:hypothetical protein